MDQNSNEKKAYEEPAVIKVKFDFSDRIAASGCFLQYDLYLSDLNTECAN